MSSSHKINHLLITASFLTILLWPLFSVPAQAAYNIEIKLPGLSGPVSDPGQYISKFFIYGMYLIGFLAVVAIAVGGLLYILSAGSPDKVSRAKSIIGGAIIGIILLFCSYLILYTIDPSLTKLSPAVLEPIRVRGMPPAARPIPLSCVARGGTTVANLAACQTQCRAAASLSYEPSDRCCICVGEIVTF